MGVKRVIAIDVLLVNDTPYWEDLIGTNKRADDRIITRLVHSEGCGKP